ncbi:hypothetical protein H310_01151 [Aphanomyces invadans]|uniref:Uncharacterized protein n=1 Tax=Aphanomyces invadans TaxID=157072 RepID=A0A024URX0_9STRA|nr:hypothetical protein H310_01151 [Aphanomyces invadans]ETW08607.1 hypothetical protein H310_01151 [Aphanomyces invadans]|eukprot:XP_008862412.1 hypothetical protein H310_01151 [Aphanomyces invadans]
MSETSRAKKKAVDPSKLNRYIDSPSSFNTDGQCRPATHLGTVHRSWNGENCDSTAFSRQPDKPWMDDESHLLQCRLNSRGKVVMLENDNIHTTVLGTTPQFNSYARIRSLESDIMDKAGPAQPGMHMMLLSHEAVANNTMVAAARVGYARVASAGLQEGIMTPAQRRERLKLETASQQANALKKKGEMKERRLMQLMQHQYPCGVLGLDGPHNADSTTYAAAAKRIETKQSHDQRQHRMREDNLQRHTSIIPALGYSYLEHDMAIKPPKVTKVCQEKMKVLGAHPDTHHRIFNETPPVWHPERAQHLRDEGQAGRPIIRAKLIHR